MKNKDKNSSQPQLMEFDIAEIDSPDFKEDSVREEVVKPILNMLGYYASGSNQIHRSKALSHPFVKTASGRRKITVFPDYLLSVDKKFVWVLDAKAPGEEITTGAHLEQVFFYAIHPEIRVKYYALCSGKEFAVFQVDSDKPLLHFHISEIKKHWGALERLLCPDAFKGQRPAASLFKNEFNYSGINPIGEVATRKQAAKRHFGVHGYFTRQSWDLVQAYIKNFTQPGDVILDPFGGYGVTFLESLMLGRNAVHIDLNPLSVFIIKSLVAPVDLAELTNTYEHILSTFQKHCPIAPDEVEEALRRYPYPKDIILPKSSDVRTIQELFTRQQLAQLAYLKSLIMKVKNENIRNSLLLCFSSSLNKFNLTFHYTRSEGGGDSGMFRYYRYRIAPQPGQNALSSIFATKFKKLLAAKKEISPLVTNETLSKSLIYKGNAAQLSEIKTESVDYIYTDPPYGSKIAYLDLSTMWNAWLGFEVSEEDRQLEAIEGGERKKTKGDYSTLIGDAIGEAYRVLRYDRWMSFVFQHQDPAYWHLIVEAAQRAGFEYVNTVTQKIGQSSFKKRQNPFTVLHGQLILNFRKTRNPQTLLKLQLGGEMTELVISTIEAIIARNQGAALEEIYNDLIIRGMELGFLHELTKEHQAIPALLREHFHYNEKRQVYEIKKNTKFKTKIPLPVRIKYYLVSYMKQMERKNVDPTFDEIVLNIMPLLKNGITPKHQTILSVLKNVAEQVGKGRWRLVENQQLELNLSGKRAAKPVLLREEEAEEQDA